MAFSRTHRAALLAALCALFAGTSAPAFAGSGGSTAPTEGSTPAGYVPANTSAGGGNGTQASSGAGSIAGSSGGIVGSKLRFRGTATGAADGDPVTVQAQGPDGAWTEIASTTTDASGAWRAGWKANRSGSLVVRAVTGANPGGGTTGAAAQAEQSPTMTVIVYQSTLASVYGVGDAGQIGNRTACGQILRASTLGVANKTLPCGTKVAFYYRGKTITVPVIDRGPYRKGYSWDLTTATADRLGFEGIGTVGSLIVSKPNAKR